MAIFSNSQEVYNFFSRFLTRLGSHPEAGPALRNSGLVLLFRLTEPEAAITVDTRATINPESRCPAYFFEDTSLEPDLALEMTAASLDELWSGRKDIFAAMLAGKVKLTGNIAKASRLLPILKAIPPLYAETWAELESTK